MVIEEGGISNLSVAQEIVLSVSVMPSGLLSLFGSSVILYNVVYRKRLVSPLERILFGLSISDIFVTLNWMIAAVFTPPVHGRTTVAFGNDATCVALGTIAQLSVATFFYNGSMSLYFLLSIVYSTRDEFFAKRIEPWLHSFIIIFCVGTASVGAAMEFFNPVGIGMGCWVVDVPFNCGDEPWETGEPCISRYLGYVYGGLPIGLTFFLVLFCMGRIYFSVRKQLNQSASNSMAPNRQQRRVRQVFARCLSYIFVFWITSISTVAVRLLETYDYPITEERKLFPLLLLQSIMVPITGFFNMCIYLTPRYLNWRSDFPERSIAWAFYQALKGDTEQRVSSAHASGTLTTNPGSKWSNRRKNSFETPSQSRSMDELFADDES